MRLFPVDFSAVLCYNQGVNWNCFAMLIISSTKQSVEQLQSLALLTIDADALPSGQLAPLIISDTNLSGAGEESLVVLIISSANYLAGPESLVVQIVRSVNC